ncbi:Flp pilus assembly protein CpaB [uncultured Paludibaculum sp.]|uniref:Flp pilus assembly protein CpaB n=1 Tax=uncultured Paludibaculum sp. TaxID=1765020 RepID=UPI002AABD847|nr:Flp pilus assembly protein CpaB [uncultured Paludibaculum sp.]
MKRNLMPLMGVAFVAAVAATGIFYGLLIPRLRGSASADNPRTAVVAVRALDRGAVLRQEDVRVVELDPKSLPPDAIPAPEQAVGLTLLEPASPNQPITTAHVAQRGSAGGPSLGIPAGRRAVSIHPSDSSGVVALMRSGSRVDIQVLDTHGVQQLRRMLEDVEVLSVTGMEQGNGRPVVTLLVAPADADRLSLADATLQLRLILRNPNDRSVEGAKSVAPTALMSGVPAARP